MLAICVNLLLHYENDILIMALVKAIRAGKVRPSRTVGTTRFCCN
jgi:hypothetical protein